MTAPKEKAPKNIDDLQEVTELAPEITKPKRSHTAKAKTGPVSFEENQQKLCRTFNALGFFFKSKKKYAEKDFIEEAKDLTRLANKYDVINLVLTLLDPLFFLFGVLSKFTEMLAAREPKTPKPAAGEVAQNGDHNAATLR